MKGIFPIDKLVKKERFYQFGKSAQYNLWNYLLLKSISLSDCNAVFLSHSRMRKEML